MRSRDDYTPPMSPKNSTGSKAASLKIEGENGGPEIFVLPPQLLKKLGINLSTILIPEEATSNNASGNGNNFCYCSFFLFVFYSMDLMFHNCLYCNKRCYNGCNKSKVQ